MDEDEDEDETIGTGAPILLGVEDVLKRSHGYEQFILQRARDKLVGFPDALCRADL